MSETGYISVKDKLVTQFYSKEWCSWVVQETKAHKKHRAPTVHGCKGGSGYSYRTMRDKGN